MNQQRDRNVSNVGKVSAGAARAAGKGVGKLMSRLPLKVKIIIIVAFLVIVLISVIAGGSISQMNNAYHLSPKGSNSRYNPSKEIRKKSIWDKDYIIEQTTVLGEVIAGFEDEDLSNQIGNLRGEISAKGWDVEESMLHLKITKIKDAEVKIESSNEVVEPVTLKKPISSFNYINKKHINDSLKLLKKKEQISDTGGLLRYKQDYIITTPATYGSVGTRFKVYLSDGSAFTAVKIDETPKNKRSSIPIRFVSTVRKLPKSVRDEKSLNSTFNNASITKMDEIRSEFNSKVFTISDTTSRVLAAFSVYMDNGQRTKNSNSIFINQRGRKSVSQDETTKYKKELKKALTSFTKDRGHFYEIDYERDAAGNINVREKVWYTEKEVRNKDTHKLEKVQVKHTSNYVYPFLTEIDANTIAEEIFDLNPEDDYVNSGGILEKTNGVTSVSEAIDTIKDMTDALLYDVQGLTSESSSGAIILSELNGELEYPTPGNTYITSRYGNRIHPVLKIRKWHDGLDIGGSYGDPIVAAEAGKVLMACWYSGYGNFVKIDHGNGLTTCYGHMNKIKVRAGQIVKRGQRIGDIGSTGRSTGPHLHFEVRVNGHTVNPEPYIKGK